jgi:hypothetical protein
VKGFSAWAKANWLILVLTGVALVALPTMLFFSSRLSAGLRKEVQTKADGDWKFIVSTSNITYTIHSVTEPDKKAFELSAVANKALIEKFAARREAITKQAALVGAEAIEFNRDDHKLLLADIFPRYKEGYEQLGPIKFAEAYIRAHADLLKAVNAGGPVDSDALAAQLEDFRQQQISRVTSQSGDAQMTEEETRKLTDELIALRLGRCRQHAASLDFFADDSIFIGVPVKPPERAPTLSTFWDWQMRYWISSDLLRAAATANSGSTTGVPGGVVKRVLRISIDPPPYPEVPDAYKPGEGEAITPQTKDPAPIDYRASITGRYSDPSSGNQYYDVRTASLDVIVSSERLPQFFDALAATNFMTVLECQLEAVDPLEDLREGYFYGDEHVVKARLTIETIWLRAWTKPYMPASVRTALAVVEDPAPPPAEGAEGGGGPN